MNIEKFKSELLNSKMWQNVQKKYDIIALSFGRNNPYSTVEGLNSINNGLVDLILVTGDHSKIKISNDEEFNVNFPEIFIWYDLETQKNYKVIWKAIKWDDLLLNLNYITESYFCYILTDLNKFLIWSDKSFMKLKAFIEANTKLLIEHIAYNWIQYLNSEHNFDLITCNFADLLYLFYKITGDKNFIALILKFSKCCIDIRNKDQIKKNLASVDLYKIDQILGNIWNQIKLYNIIDNKKIISNFIEEEKYINGTGTKSITN